MTALPSDDSLTAAQAAGESDYFNTPIDGGAITCNGCHVLDPAQGFFGTDGQQRNGYEVVGYMKAKDFANHVRMATGNSGTLSASNQ